MTLTNNEIKDIMKVIKSLENRGTLLKETTIKITSQEGRFLYFFRPLMTFVLPLRLSAGMSAIDVAIQKKIYESETTVLIIQMKKWKM